MVTLKMINYNRLTPTIYKCDPASDFLLIAQLLLFVIKACKQPHSDL